MKLKIVFIVKVNLGLLIKFRKIQAQILPKYIDIFDH